jgi:hypothetical protein
MPLWHKVYLISCIYDMTPLSQLYVCMSYVTCITIIDTIILTIYTNNAYTYDTYQLAHCYRRGGMLLKGCQLGDDFLTTGYAHTPFLLSSLLALATEGSMCVCVHVCVCVCVYVCMVLD